MCTKLDTYTTLNLESSITDVTVMPLANDANARCVGLRITFVMHGKYYRTAVIISGW